MFLRLEAWETLEAEAFIEAISVNMSFSAVSETAQKSLSAKMLQPFGGGRRRKNRPALTWQAGPFCSGKEQRSFLLLGFSLRRYGKNDYVPFLSRTDRHAMISTSLMREDKLCHGRQQKDEGWLNIMVARHDDGDDSIGDRRSSSLARHGAMRIGSTWSAGR